VRRLLDQPGHPTVGTQFRDSELARIEHLGQQDLRIGPLDVDAA